MMPGGTLADLLGTFFGTGRGAGIGLVIVIGGVIAIINGLAGYLIKPIREIETILPDRGVVDSNAVA
jgi:hypothetical protein